jgi:exosortase
MSSTLPAVPITAPTPKAHSRAPFLGFGALLASSVFLWEAPLALTLKASLSNDAYTHILLVIPISLFLICFEAKKGVASAEMRRQVGAILLAVALLLRTVPLWKQWGLEASDALSLNMFALVVWWIGSVIVCFGVQSYWRALFPLNFLFLVVPLPERAVDWLTVFLQRQSAIAATVLFHIVRVPVARDGIILSIPGLNIEVSRECSSIRSSTMLLVLTLVLAHLFLRSWWRQILVVVAAMPLAVLKNAIRIFTIAELGTRVDPAYLHGNLHRHGGVLFLALAMSIVFLLLWLFRRGETSIGGSPAMDPLDCIPQNVLHP